MNAELVPMDCVCSWEHVSLLNHIFLVSSLTKGEGAKCEADDLKTALRRFLVNNRKLCLCVELHLLLFTSMFISYFLHLLARCCRFGLFSKNLLTHRVMCIMFKSSLLNLSALTSCLSLSYHNKGGKKIITIFYIMFRRQIR